MNPKQYNKEILVKDYFDIHNFYSKIYGEGKTIILMQVGSFHEAYCTNEKGIDLVALAQKLDVVCTKKNGGKEISDSNPRMLGFPIHVTYNHIEKLVNLSYTIVLIDQTTEKPNIKREVTAIYSPATFMENNNKAQVNNLVSIVIDKYKTKSLSYELCIGVASYDLATGNGHFYETYSQSNDKLVALDDVIRFLETSPPKEILILNRINDSDELQKMIGMNIDDIINYLHINTKNIFNVSLENQHKTKYQEQILEKVFPTNNMLNVFENLNLTHYNYSRLALVILLEYISLHQMNLLNNIKKPLNFICDKYLYYGNRATDQLNVFVSNENTTMQGNDNTHKSLYNVINNTKTSLGQRYLINSLTKPLICKNELNKRYNIIESLIKNKYYEKIESYLSIYDIERLQRRIDMKTLHPFELNQLMVSFYQIENLVNFIKTNKLDILFTTNNNDLLISDINDFQNYINTIFDTVKLENVNFTNYFDATTSFYQDNVYPEIDKLVLDIDTGNNFIDLLKNELENLISDDKSLFGKAENSLISSKYNERDGHYMLITNRRCKLLKSKLEKISSKTINIGSYKLNINDLVFNELPKSSSTKISCEKIKDISNEIIIAKQKLAVLNKSTFKDTLETISKKYSELFGFWSNMIGYIDFMNSGAICVIKNKYTKPVIKENNENISFFTATSLRHPIIEVINKNYNYVPHDIGLGYSNDVDGILLYGINSSGKSTLMKSIGLNIILAQIGYYVSANSFTYYPYNTLFTRIVGNDNIFKGLSSFMVEMMELTCILKRNNKNTLVIGDEICRGTEEKSANIIVAYMLETLANSNSSFITATHLHKIANLNCVKNLERVKAKHLKITYDSLNEELIYDRILSDGQGESFYGLMVAKYLMKDNVFNTRTTEILADYDDTSIRKSHYNDDYLLKCHICSATKNLESHHIVPQKDFDEDMTHKSKLHLKKNNSSNLVTLCEKCHDKIDNELVINGWIETSNGKKLDYHYIEKIKTSKYTPELIEYIIELKRLGDVRIARTKIIEKFNKKISTASINKYWN